MNPPADESDLRPEKHEQDKETSALFHCGLYDANIVRKIAEEFLTGLASACVDNTTGGLFRSPGSVAIDIRKELIDYVIQRSEKLASESIVLDDGLNDDLYDDPFEIISDFVDDFARSKRNFFSKVSVWLLSERREDRIDDFVQEMEMNSFWLLSRRESIAQKVLKNIDLKLLFHCTMSFGSVEEVEEHKSNCGFRTMICPNEGCNATFSASQCLNHDSICPFKMLKCEQNCDDLIMRRDMDRHCITVCPMKLVKCPFHSVGCSSLVTKCSIDKHRKDEINSHLFLVLQYFHKEASSENLLFRVEELIELSSSEKLASARDARALTSAVKDLESRLGPLKVKTTEDKSDEVKDNITIVDVDPEESPKEKTDTPAEQEEQFDIQNDSSSSKENIENAQEESQVSEVKPPDNVFGTVDSNSSSSSNEQKDSDKNVNTEDSKEQKGLNASEETESNDKNVRFEVKHDDIEINIRDSGLSSSRDENHGSVASSETENSDKNVSSEEITKTA